MEKKFSFKSDNETITATIDYCHGNSTTPSILSLHGAGPSNRDRIAYLTKHLAEKGRSCLRFDFSGHRDSTGKLEESSLKKRVAEALTACQFLSSKNKIDILIATSMGGHIALELLSEIDVGTLILFCPAAYCQEAYDVPFTKEFTSIIRGRNSFLNATVFEKLKKFKGRFLLFIGDQDDIIPPGVLEMYNLNSKNAEYKKIVTIPNAPHAIHAWLEKNPEFKKIIFSEVDNVLKEF
jgi:uncharacterized protein